MASITAQWIASYRKLTTILKPSSPRLPQYAISPCASYEPMQHAKLNWVSLKTDFALCHLIKQSGRRQLIGDKLEVATMWQ